MVLVEEFLEGSRRVAKAWLFLLAVEAAICFVLAIVAGAVRPASGMWLAEYLSWIKGLPNGDDLDPFRLAQVWFPVHLISVAANFLMARWLLRSADGMHRGINRRSIVRIRRHLVRIMVWSWISLFALMVHGLLWWACVALLLSSKYLFIREVQRLDPEDIRRNIEFSRRKIRRALVRSDTPQADEIYTHTEGL